MDSIEDAAELVAATAGCDRGEAEEVAAALRRDGGEEVETGEPEPAGNVAAGFMPESMDEDAALAEALRLSALDAEVVDVPVPPTHTHAPAPGGELLGWADAQLSMFTGEEDNAFLVAPHAQISWRMIANTAASTPEMATSSTTVSSTGPTARRRRMPTSHTSPMHARAAR